MKDNKNKNRDHMITIQPFPKRFFDLIKKGENIKPEDFFKSNHYYYKIQHNKEGKIGIYEKRKELGKKVEFNYKVLEENIIIPALQKIDGEKAEKLLIKHSVYFIDEFISKYKNEYKSLIGKINRYKGFLQKDISPDKVEEYSIKLESLEAELKQINTEIDNIIITFSEIKQRIKHLENFFLSANILKKRTIIGLLFERLVLDEHYLYLHTHSYLKSIFNLNNTLVIKKDL